MDVIEKELYLSVEGDSPDLTETSLHLLRAGGKRLRPVFVLMGGKFGDYDIDKLKHVAVPLEMIHSASLVHDDVIDDADTRRGKPTVKAKWDNRVAMYTGDYIYGKALELTTHLKRRRFIKFSPRRWSRCPSGKWSRFVISLIPIRTSEGTFCVYAAKRRS